MGQTSIFDYLYQEYKITKPIRLIEMFAGYGSQHLALKYLGLQVESHKIIEWAVPSIQAYKDLHCENKNNDYTVDMTSDELLNKLVQYEVSSNYNEPMTYEQIKRKGYEWQKRVYNNIKNTNNLVNIMNVKGEDLEISELDKYDYIMTYSFPCQDLSLAGKRLGMDADSKTRSSMLWQVHRILDELKELNKLPNVLLMENVPQVMAKDNLQNMEKWDDFLSKLGYKSYIKNLIATDYGIPQIRNRTFMISILGDYVYTFPRPTPLELKLSDLLEKEVDEKYFLSDKMIECFMTIPKSGYPRDERFMTSLNSVNQNDVANTITTRAGSRPSDNFLIIPEATKKGYAEAKDGDGVYINRPHQKRGVVQKGKIQTIKTSCDDIGVVVGKSQGIATNESDEWKKKPLDELSRTLLANKSNCGVGVIESDNRNAKQRLCDNLLKLPEIEPGDVVKHSFTSEISSGNKKAIEMKNIMPTMTTRIDTLGVVVNNEKSDKLRIRKITPLEAFRLMGVKDEDYQRIAANQSNSSLYHLAGDSIVVNVLMAIFKQLL